MDENSKSPFHSKKFWAFLISEITWKIVLTLVLFWGKDSIPHQVWAIMIGIILVAGFIEVAYIAGQAALDRYIQVAQIAADAGKDVVMKGVTMGNPKSDPDSEEQR